MKDKVILITGAASGIGKTIAQHFHSLGASIIMADRSEAKLLAMKEELGERAYGVTTDLSELNAVKEIFSYCKREGLLLDSAIHCAGVTLNCPLRANDPQETEKLLRINLGAFIEICHYCASKRYMKSGGSIIGLSSIAALGRFKGLAAYAASKAGMEVVVKVASAELVDRMIRVNAISPGEVNTPMLHNSVKEAPEVQERIPTIQPLGLIEPERIADMAEFLISDKACNITGETIMVGSGFFK